MKNFCAAIAISITFFGGSAWAGSLSDPIVAPEVVVAEAEADSGKVDALILAIWLAAALAAAGGF